MDPKGYDHPLHSLLLLPAGQSWPDDAWYAIQVPQGRLVVRPALRCRGADVSTWVCDQALALGLSRHGLAVPGFAQHGLDAQWAANMKHWGDRLIAQHQRRIQLDTERTLCAAALEDHVRVAREGWGRLSLAARLCGLGGLLVRGNAPRGVLLHESLTEALLRARQPDRAALLSSAGVGSGELDTIQGRLDALAAARRQLHDLDLALRQASAELIVIRAALIGDLSRLCLAAPYVLCESQRAGLQMTRLFTQRRRRAKDPIAGRPPAGPAIPVPQA